MLIGIDVSLTAESTTGLPSYARSLVEALARIDGTNRSLLYPFVWHSFPQHYERAVCPRRRNFKRSRRWWPKPLVERLWRDPRVSKNRLVGRAPGVYLSPFHSTPPRHLRRLVCVFHDVAFRVHPEFSTEINRVYCEEQFAAATRRADKLITVSHFSKAEIVRHMGVPADWIEVTHDAADPRFHPLPNAHLPERIARAIGRPEQIILYVGSVEPRKNLRTLVRAYHALCERRRARTPLVIAGGSGWKNEGVYEDIARRGLGDRVHFTGFVTGEELVALYNVATVFVYPTIYEGFGLPVIEAMSCGAPVVTTRVASIPEVAGEAATYVDEPLDADALAGTLERVLLEPERREEMRARGLAQAARFTWERTARQTLDVLEAVATEPRYRRRGVSIGEDERGLGRGWHGLEVENGIAYRWTARQATLHLTPASGELLVEASTSVPRRVQQLAVRVNGQVIGHAELEHSWRTFRFHVDLGSGSARPVEVGLQATFAVPPSIKAADSRELGVKIRRMRFDETGGA